MPAVILLFYGPFWVGHRLRDIVNSFSEAPSVRSAENSILRAVTEWVKANGLPPHTSWTYMPLHVFSQHPIWNDINIAVVAVTLLAGSIWLWRNPAIRTMALVTLGTLGAWLVVTPWFYPWYVTWLVGLVVICLPVMHERLGRALIAFTVTFSASAFFTYYYNVHPPLRTWSGFDSITIIAPPLLAFLFFFFFGWHSRGQVGEKVV